MSYRTAKGVDVTFPLANATLREANGSYSGTFSGAAAPGTTTATLAVTDGTFTGVHP
ncbi:putative Ig domain-containing protein [Hymenobacter rubidus]|uniref:putative Ig domain-containing protein n=1 Tax=Hymenobacter rubidus TaxID=1441626 RepID=UPI00191D471E|nr:putative Ig domain-containing protein [Hymenobacter rubidus]